MKMHYVTLEIAIELEDEDNVYERVNSVIGNYMDIIYSEIINVETKQL